MRVALSARRWLLAVLVVIATVTLALTRWHTPRSDDPYDTALALIMATMAGSYLLFMLVTRDQWTAASLGLFALLLGDLLLWGVLIALTRLDVITTTPIWVLNLLRAAFFVAGTILLVDLVRWTWERWRPGR